MKIVQNANGAGEKFASTVFVNLYPGLNYSLRISSMSVCSDGIEKSDLADFFNITVEKDGTAIRPMSKISDEEYLKTVNHALVLFQPSSTKLVNCMIMQQLSSASTISTNIFISYFAFLTVLYLGK